MILVHPNLPGQSVDVNERKAAVMAKSGWVPASKKDLATLEKNAPPKKKALVVPAGQVESQTSEVPSAKASEVSELDQGHDVE